MVKPKPKLLAEKTRLKKVVERFPSEFWAHMKGADGRMVSIPRLTNDIDRGHVRDDAWAHQTINERALKQIREGKIRLAETSFQHGPGKDEVVRTSTMMQPLEEFLNKTKSKKDVGDVYLDLMRHLAYLHGEAGISHGDVSGKAGKVNVLVRDGKTHLYDFGESWDLNPQKQSPPEKTGYLLQKDVSGAVKIFAPHVPKETVVRGVDEYLRTLKKTARNGAFTDAGAFDDIEWYKRNLRL